MTELGGREFSAHAAAISTSLPARAPSPVCIGSASTYYSTHIPFEGKAFLGMNARGILYRLSTIVQGKLVELSG